MASILRNNLHHLSNGFSRTMKLPFPNVVDDTLLSNYGACPQRANMEYLQHWKAKQESDHLVAGGAYADALEALRHHYFILGESLEHSIAHAFVAATRAYGNHKCIDERKTLDRVYGAIVHYVNYFNPMFDEWKPAIIGAQEGIEFSFLVPLPHPDGGEILHPTTGDPILYSGRADAIVENSSGMRYLLDDKTCTQLGNTWGSKWRLRSQFTGYYWGCLQYGIETLGVIVRGNCFYQAIRPETGDIYVCKQVISQRTPKDAEVWLRTTQRRLLSIIEDWKSGEFSYNLGDSCNSYGGCQFEKICTARFPENWLNSHFEQKVWDPVQRKVIPLNRSPGD